MKISSPSFCRTLESQSSQKSSLFNHRPSNLFLPSLPTDSHHPTSIQDAPLALITKPRSQSTPEKPLLAVTSSFNKPINLSLTGVRQPSKAPTPAGRTSISPALTSGASSGNGCKPVPRGVKRGRLGPIRGPESDLASSNDSEDSVMDEENDVSNDSLSGQITDGVCY